MHQLTNELKFPSPLTANKDGIVAYGGDLNPERILLAYQNGIFPWFEDDNYLLWWSPDPRMVLFPQNLKISKSTRKFMRETSFQITFNKSFMEVVNACAKVKRFGQNGTWITNGLKEAYKLLHQKGHAYSVEVWENMELGWALWN